MTELTTERAGLDVTAVSRLKHTELWEAAKAFGSVCALARHLGVCQNELGRWVNLRACPHKAPTKSWPQERLEGLEEDLLEITGKMLAELFPDSLRRSGFLDHTKIAEKTHTLSMEAMETYALVNRDRLQRRGRIEAVENEEREQVAEVIRQSGLTQRERLIVTHSYGLDGGNAWSRQKLSKECGVSCARINQILSKAIKRLRRNNATDLVGLLDGGRYDLAMEGIEEARQDQEALATIGRRRL